MAKKKKIEPLYWDLASLVHTLRVGRRAELKQPALYKALTLDRTTDGEIADALRFALESRGNELGIKPSVVRNAILGSDKRTQTNGILSKETLKLIQAFGVTPNHLVCFEDPIWSRLRPGGTVELYLGTHIGTFDSPSLMITDEWLLTETDVVAKAQLLAYIQRSSPSFSRFGINVSKSPMSLGATKAKDRTPKQRTGRNRSKVGSKTVPPTQQDLYRAEFDKWFDLMTGSSRNVTAQIAIGSICANVAAGALAKSIFVGVPTMQVPYMTFFSDSISQERDNLGVFSISSNKDDNNVLTFQGKRFPYSVDGDDIEDYGIVVLAMRESKPIQAIIAGIGKHGTLAGLKVMHGSLARALVARDGGGDFQILGKGTIGVALVKCKAKKDELEPHSITVEQIGSRNDL